MSDQLNRNNYDELEFIRNIIDTIREPLIILNSNLTVIYVNKSFYKIFKVSKKNTINELLYNLGNQQWDIPELRQLLEEILQKNNIFEDYLVEHTFENIGKKIMKLNGRKIQNTKDNSELILLAIEDVTLQKEYEKKLIQLKDEKNYFIGMAAHDIRSPLTVIKGMAELITSLYSSYLPQKAIDYLDTISNKSDYIVNLVNNYLDYSKIESGKLSLDLKLNNYSDILKEIIDFQRLLSKRKIKIMLNFHSKIPMFLFDADKIIQVLNNILSNSFKYSEDNTSITVNVFVKENYLITEIKDEGIGIPEDKLSMIFQPYYNLSNKTIDMSKSTGLGLAIVKKIINAHNGIVEVKSEIKEGTTFIFKLPLRTK